MAAVSGGAVLTGARPRGLERLSPATVVVWGFFMTLPVERVLTVDVFGFTLRPAYVFMAAFVLLKWRCMAAGVRAMPTALLVVAAVLASLTATADLRVSLGYALWALLVVAFALAAVGWLATDRARVRRWADVYVVTAAGWGAVAAAQWVAAYAAPGLAYGWIGGAIPRIHLLAYEPSFLAFYLVPALLLAAASERALLAAPILVALLLSTSRTGLLGVAVGAIVLLVLGDRAIRSRAAKATAIAGVVVVVQVAPSLLDLEYSKRGRVDVSTATKEATTPGGKERRGYGEFVYAGVTGSDAASAHPRLESWKRAVLVFTDRPVTGAGIGAYGAALHEEGLRRHVPAPRLKTTNMWLETAAEMGSLGLLALVAWAFAPVPALWRGRTDALALALLAGVGASAAMLAFVQTWWVPYHWVPWILAYALAAKARA